MSTPNKQRLASLDILRGFDLFLLLFVGPVVSSLAAVSDAEWTTTLAYHFDHAAWDGLVLLFILRWMYRNNIFWKV